jgi:hypothetical protein
MSPTLAARRARVARIRRAVTAAAIAVFIALFATIYIQMAAGKDPALSASTSTAQISTTSTTSSDNTTASDDSNSSSDDSSSDDSSSGAAMTTSQS